MSLLREVIRVILKEYARDLEMEPDMSVAAVKFRDMPNKRWFVSPHYDMWYYHVPRRGSTHELDIHELSETLDPCLRDLALSLNARGCRTLPSCQGHYHTPERLSRAYDALLFDASQIRDMGLELRDVTFLAFLLKVGTLEELLLLILEFNADCIFCGFSP